MYVQLFGLLLFACQIISNGSYEIQPVADSITTIKSELAEPSTLPEGYVSFSDDHAAYKVYQEAVTWEEARDLCIAEGARLAIANTGDKIKHIYSTVSDVRDWISVGIRFQNTTNEWVRIDNGNALTSLPWKVDKPDNRGDCVGISFSGKHLANFICEGLTNWYVCEISI